jgi:uncharacterized membrane protein
MTTPTPTAFPGAGFDPNERRTDEPDMDTSRLEAFSDGVLAIVITLLVLGIEVPTSSAALGQALVRLWPSYLAYAVSFLLIGAIWVNHHAMFRYIVRADATLLVLNLLHLMVVAFMPFSTAVLAQAFLSGTDEPIAAAFYGAVLAVGGVFVNLMWRYATHDRRLLGAGVTDVQIQSINRRFLVGPALYAIATIVGLVAPWLALLLYVALIGFYLLLPARSHLQRPHNNAIGDT